MVVVQIVVVAWTKASRGQPGADRRAAVPERLALPRSEVLGAAPSTPDGVLVHEVRADEADGFELVTTALHTETLPLRIGNVLVEAVPPAAVRVTRRAESGLGWPARPRDARPIVLAAGERCSILRNHRFSGYHGWSYQKSALNVAHVDEPSAEVFTAVEPDVVLDEQASLF